MYQTEFDLTVESSPERYFLGWDDCLLSLVSQWLLDLGEDLASTLVVVPTTNSGRRLRMALATHGGGVLSPHVMVPSRLFEVDGVASRQESLWAWVRVIQRITIEDFPYLLPNHTSQSVKGFRSALALARQLISLRDQLADGDASFRDAGFHSVEKERWEELDSLESKMLKQLGQWKLRDAVLTKRKQAKNPKLPPSVNKIVVACVPDPTPLAQRALRALLSQGVPTTVLIHAEESESSSFDSWGIPLHSKWKEKEIIFPDWEKRLHLVDSSFEAADSCIRIFGEEETESDDAALILCDTTLSTTLRSSFSDAGWPLFDPEGESLNGTGLVRVIKVIGELVREPAPFSALQELIRLPGAEPFLPENMNRHDAAKLMDDLQVRHMPETVHDARQMAVNDQVLTVIDSVLAHVKSLTQEDALLKLRSCLAIWLETTNNQLNGTSETAEPRLVEALDALERLQSFSQLPTTSDIFEMLVEALSSVKSTENSDHTALDLQGWLEISYDPAPHLVLAGIHEECVPDGAVDDLFIPNSLRQKLGLRDAEGRYARDAFLLQGALRSRDQTGRVDAVVSRFNDAGEARKPSRLLMCVKRNELPAIVQHLFAEPTSTSYKGVAWQRDWTLRLPDVENPYCGHNPKKISPSALSDYLNCPLRFYLKRILKMERCESGKQEMNAADFGNLCHKVLECYGSDSVARDLVDDRVICDYLFSKLDEVVDRQYGRNLSLPLMVQKESARERLRAFAVKQAEDRANGWVIVEAELEVGRRNGSIEWILAGHPMTMIVDRVDRNEDGKRWRVWDYKTSGKASKPNRQHLKRWDEKENRPLLGELITFKKNMEYRWASLQLPIYAAFIQERFKIEELPKIGYINLPRAVLDVDFSPWSDFDQQLFDSAMTWAEAAIGMIKTGEFHQVASLPTQERSWDNFAELSPDGLAEAFGI